MRDFLKKFALLTVLGSLLAGALLAGCGGGGDDESNTTTNTTTTTKDKDAEG